MFRVKKIYMFKVRKIYMLSQVRYLSTSPVLNAAQDNGSDSLLDRIDSLEKECSDLEYEVEELTKEVKESEQAYNSNSNDEATALSQHIDKMTKEKDESMITSNVDRDTALFVNNDVVADRSIALEQIERNCKKDIDTLVDMEEELEKFNPSQDKIGPLLQKLEDKLNECYDLREELESSNNNESKES